MAIDSTSNRPPFDQAVAAWKTTLSERALPADLIWIFDENLCFEEDPRKKGASKLGFQTRITPPPPEAEQIAYEHFAEFELPVVFYRLGSSKGKSVCLLLCDEWFESKTEAVGYFRRPEFNLFFRPGGPEEIEEIADEERYHRRVVRNRPIHDLDFCMTLRGVHEILAHGRVLTSYEHYALKLLHAWKRFLAQPQ